MSRPERRHVPALDGVPAPGPRLVLALALGLAVGVFCAVSLRRGATGSPSDFEYWWTATRAWLAGVDPYRLAPRTPGWRLIDPLFYPLPALVLTGPLAPLPLPIAAGVFMGMSSALLAWALSAGGWGRLWVLASPAFVMAIQLGQWSPLLTAGLLLPSLGFVLAVKPTLGLALWSARPTWRAALGVAALLALSLVLMPAWPAAWLANLGRVVHHPAPILTPLGAPVLLALLRWRQPEARLLVAMACVPQLLLFADQLPLGLVARTRQEAAALSLCGCLAWLAWFLSERSNPYNVLPAMPYVLAGLYLPALVVVWRRPNEGAVPVWAERLAAWRPWRRGKVAADA